MILPKPDPFFRTTKTGTHDANELVAEIHDRMPLILAATDYIRWLSDEADPRELRSNSAQFSDTCRSIYFIFCCLGDMRR